MWSRNELRRALRAGLAEQCDPKKLPKLPSGGGGDKREAASSAPGSAGAGKGGTRRLTTLTIELSARQLDYYSQVAATHGLPVDKWVTQVLDAADRAGV
jgi:hypothetical protein